MLLGAFLTTTYVDSHRSNYGYQHNYVEKERIAIEVENPNNNSLE